MARVVELWHLHKKPQIKPTTLYLILRSLYGKKLTEFFFLFPAFGSTINIFQLLVFSAFIKPSSITSKPTRYFSFFINSYEKFIFKISEISISVDNLISVLLVTNGQSCRAVALT